MLKNETLVTAIKARNKIIARRDSGVMFSRIVIGMRGEEIGMVCEKVTGDKVINRAQKIIGIVVTVISWDIKRC